MKVLIYVLLIIFFNSCGDNIRSSNGDSDSDVNTSIITDSNTNPLFYQQWSINYDENFYLENSIDKDAGINSQNVWRNYTGKGVKIAIIDDGFDVTHPEIKNKIIKTASVDDYGFVSSDATHLSSLDFHGTAVAGIIGAVNNSLGIQGVAPDAELILIRYPLYLSDAIVIELFEQALAADADVINCSWGTNNVSDTIRDYINYISTYGRNGKGVVVVFASGNTNEDISTDESSIVSVIGVGATDRENLRTWYSSYGKDLDIVAPGGYELGITTIDPVGSYGSSIDDYIRYNESSNGYINSFIGTSAAAPIVAGVIALGLEKDNSLTREEIQELLKSSTTTIGNNTPYIDDMIVSSSLTPSITGIYGASGEGDFSVRLVSSSGRRYGPYSIDSIGNNEWSATVTDALSNGIYTIEVIENSEGFILATDTEFEVNTQKVSLKDKTKRKSDFYGYGKIDLEKFINSI